MKTSGEYDGLYYECDPDGQHFVRVEIVLNDPDYDGQPPALRPVRRIIHTPLPHVTSWGEVAQMHGQEVVLCYLCHVTDEIDIWESPVAARMRERGLCWSCQHWLTRFIEPIEHGQQPYDQPYAVVGGVVFIIGPEPDGHEDAPVRGYGGRRFTFTYTATGHQVTSRNVSCAGIIPAHLRHRLPDNATFCHRPLPGGR